METSLNPAHGLSVASVSTYKKPHPVRRPLSEKASYLCFIPRTNNEYVKRSKLIKVEIMSDDDIAGTYNIAADGTLTLASGSSKTITVTTGSNFDIDNSADDMSKNATYAVVAPGTHSFRVRYWLRNTTDNPDGPIEGTVSKIVTVNCTAGSINDITANLDPHNYDGDHYYMWDAKEQYWKGYEWTQNLPAGVGQPTLNLYISSNYPKSNADPRYKNESYPGYGISNPAIHSCKDLPNANEMTWYATSDPRWDADELWTTMGHLYKGGMWFKKKSQISGYNPNTAVDGTDWRTTVKYKSWTPSQTPPSAADAGNYFYLPALGWYNNSGQVNGVGGAGYYWSSSANPQNGGAGAYELSFYGSRVYVGSDIRYYGLSVDGFE